MYKVADLIKNASESPLPDYRLNSSQNRASEIITRAYNERGVGLVQGPPGTGKTSVLISSITNILGDLDKNEVLVYVAPTNELVKDVATKIIPILTKKLEYSVDDIRKAIRIFGSDFDYRGVPEVRSPINKDVKIILTTDYQKFYISFKEAEGKGYSFSFLVDEASKSPIYRFLTPIAMELIKAEKRGGTEPDIHIDSLSVVGDPMQAISKKRIYTMHREYLLMVNILKNMVYNVDPSLADQLGNSALNLYDIIQQNSSILSSLKNFVMLDVTYRVPAPSHMIISTGFYNGRLSANESVEKRLEYRDDLVRAIGRDFIASNKVARKISEAVANGKGIVYIDVKRTAYRDFQGENIDSRRAIRAIEAAIAASIVTGKSTKIIPVYRDMATYINFIMNTQDRYKKYVEALRNGGQGIDISVGTAHSLLGAEDENVVLVLGKEYLPAYSDLSSSTMYFAEPEIFNVQFSRHRALLVIVGNLERLYVNSKRIYRYYSSLTSRSLYTSILEFNSKMLMNSSREALDLCGITMRGITPKYRNDMEHCERITDEG